MAVHRFQVIMPVDTLLPRDAYTNTFHMDHVGAPLTTANLNSVADSVIDMWQARYGSVAGEVRCKVWALGGAKLGPPDANRVKAVGTAWQTGWPREIALCLSFAADKSDPSQRGRLYLAPDLKIGGSAFSIGQRPSTDTMSWALDFFTASNQSLPDLGGVDWKFGIYSPSQNAFHQAQVAWVDDEWDTVRSRGLRAITRQTAAREG